MNFVSYAQNFEDVMLWRALKDVENGLYIDVGAHHPIRDSVSLAFHQRGWRGIHVEPLPECAELLRQQRPGDLIVQALVSDAPGLSRFFLIDGLSTADAGIADQHRGRGIQFTETMMPGVTLGEVLELAQGHPIHWLKIDVEGHETEALGSWGKRAGPRPWIVVVESTLPLTEIESFNSWEPALLARGYEFAYFDGLNRFYVAKAHLELKAAFKRPPNVFDDFGLNGTASASYHIPIVERYEQQAAAARAQYQLEMGQTRMELGEVRTASAIADQRLQALRGESDSLQARLGTAQQRLAEVLQQTLEAERRIEQVRSEATSRYALEAYELRRENRERENLLWDAARTCEAEVRRCVESRRDEADGWAQERATMRADAEARMQERAREHEALRFDLQEQLARAAGDQASVAQRLATMEREARQLQERLAIASAQSAQWQERARLVLAEREGLAQQHQATEAHNELRKRALIEAIVGQRGLLAADVEPLRHQLRQRSETLNATR